MNTVQSITVVEDVTLISLQDSPADITLISKIFEMISGAGIDVDMISQTPPHRNMPGKCPKFCNNFKPGDPRNVENFGVFQHVFTPLPPCGGGFFRAMIYSVIV